MPSTVQLPAVPSKKKVITIDNIIFNQSNSIFNILPKAVASNTPLSFEDLNQPYGFVLYQTVLQPHAAGNLKIGVLNDYGIVMVDGVFIGTVDRRLKQDSIYLPANSSVAKLDILVENMGRINFGKYLLKNKKGITETVLLNGKKNIGLENVPIAFRSFTRYKVSKVNKYRK